MHNTLRALLLGTVLSMGAVSFGAAPAAAAVNIDGQVQHGRRPGRTIRNRGKTPGLDTFFACHGSGDFEFKLCEPLAKIRKRRIFLPPQRRIRLGGCRTSH